MNLAVLHGCYPGNGVTAERECGDLMRALWRVNGGRGHAVPRASRRAWRARIGEYNGVASSGGSSFVVWCGNTRSGPDAVDQQTVFDAFQTDWQTSVDLVDLFHRTPAIELEAPQPNPAATSFVAKYALPRTSPVDLALMDVQGRRVATLVHGTQPAGRHIVAWQAPNAGTIAAGVYLLRLTDGRETAARRVVMMGSGGRGVETGPGR